MSLVEYVSHSLCFQHEVGIDGLDLPPKPPPEPPMHKRSRGEAAVAAIDILCEAIQHMARTKPILSDLINIFTTGFLDVDLPGLTTTDITELLGVSESTVSRARNDPHNIMMKLKYPPGVKPSRIDDEQYKLIDTTLDQFVFTISRSEVLLMHVIHLVYHLMLLYRRKVLVLI